MLSNWRGLALCECSSFIYPLSIRPSSSAPCSLLRPSNYPFNCSALGLVPCARCPGSRCCLQKFWRAFRGCQLISRDLLRLVLVSKLHLKCINCGAMRLNRASRAPAPAHASVPHSDRTPSAYCQSLIMHLSLTLCLLFFLLSSQRTARISRAWSRNANAPPTHATRYSSWRRSSTTIAT